MVAARLVQGFASEGELGLSATALIEAADPDRRTAAVGRLRATAPLGQASRGNLALPAAVLVVATSTVVVYAVSFTASDALTTRKLPAATVILATVAAGGDTVVLGSAGGLARRPHRPPDRAGAAAPRPVATGLVCLWSLTGSRSAVAVSAALGG